jgi:hypothetical protein
MTVLALAGVLAAAPDAPDASGSPPSPDLMTVSITHRVFVDFHDTLTVAMNERHTIGDTEFSFELTEFYPDFAIDTNNTIASLSDEPRNPAFKVAVFENGEKTEDTWAFYGIDIPHYGRKSYLAFKVLAFEYRGEILGATSGEEKKQ